jgi:hypothetical protein
MPITDAFVLPMGTTIQPVTDLPETFRKQIASEDGDFIVSRANARALSKVIDAAGAALVREFVEPSTIAQAVARFSRGKDTAAERLLEDALPLLQSLIGTRLLVEADSPEAARIEPELDAGAEVDGWFVVRCLQSLDDSELYQVRNPLGDFGALKIGRRGHAAARHTIGTEAHILGSLDATVTPRLLAAGERDGRPYLVVEWCQGTDAQTVFAEFRQTKTPQAYRAIRDIAGAILGAFARLHEQGVAHGDIHPRNILVDRDYAVQIIDLGLARSPRDNERQVVSHRGGVSFFFEPEFALAALRRAPVPAATFAGEQYGLAAMLYLLCAGTHYLDFSLERTEMFRQIAEAPMLAFAERGLPSWPDVELLLAKALEKNPTARFSSTSAFAEAWLTVEPPRDAAATFESSGAPPNALADLRESVMRRSSLDQPLLTPATSVNYGSAGFAFALYRMACATDDAELLAWADLWSTRALSEVENEGAFYDAAIEITPENVGRTSLYHSAAGVYAVQGLIAQARRDLSAVGTATSAFIEVSRRPGDHHDVTLGRAGSLLGCTLLLDAWRSPTPPGGVADKTALVALGREVCAELWRIIDDYGPIRDEPRLSNLGIAHGWAGLLYATLCWCAASGETAPETLPARLRQLADCGEPVGRGLRWKWDLGTRSGKPAQEPMPGWCNGSAGYVFLWSAAHTALGDDRYRDLAEGAAWHVWETPSTNGSLCCGIAGKAYALLNQYRSSGDSVWLRRARDMALSAADAAAAQRGMLGAFERPDSLYKGDVGIALLAVDLERPEHARMPMFERDA